MTVFGNRAFKELIKLKEAVRVSPSPFSLVSLQKRGLRHTRGAYVQRHEHGEEADYIQVKEADYIQVKERGLEQNFPLCPSEKTNSTSTFIFDFQPPKLQKSISGCLGHIVCSILLLQP